MFTDGCATSTFPESRPTEMGTATGCSGCDFSLTRKVTLPPFSVVTGSLASLFLGQAPASVGASGGILGCLGFLIVVTRKFRDQLPDYLRANLIMSCVVIAIFGLMGSQFIDNAAHAGGFIGGVVLGELLYSQLKLVPGSTRKSIGLVSIISVTILLAGVAKVFWEFWSVSQSLFGSA